MKRWGESSYNSRLFSGGLRSRLHGARFRWLAGTIEKLGCPCESVVELGCFDAKTIGFLPSQPKRYAGFDAGWEGGLDQAREKWKDNKGYSFTNCTSPEHVNLTEQFDIAVCMETMEHLPDEQLPEYLRKLAEATRHYLFVSVPNEKGLVFATKWCAKRVAGDYLRYTPAEFLHATLGNCDKVARDEHKGFDYAKLVEKISRHFDVQSVSGLPFEGLPRQFGFTIGILAKPRRAQ